MYDSTLSLDQAASRFAGARRQGRGYMARCPAHDDSKASLSISAGDGGRILLHCHAGCTFDAVAKAANLTVADLTPEKMNGRSHHHGNGKVAKKQVAVYVYEDEHGQPIFRKIRYKPKGFALQRCVDGNWKYGLADARRVLYRLPRLVEADAERTVYVCEGEKDVERAEKLGCLATTNFDGAGKWRDEYSIHFRDRNVIVVPDNDSPGRQHAETVARSLHGTASSVRVLHLPGLAEHGDLSDWADAGGTDEELWELAEAAPLWTPSDAASASTEQTKRHPGLPAVLLAEHRTEAATARRFVAMHGENVRYCSPWGKWLIWDGMRWRLDDTCQIEALAKQTADAIWSEIKEELPTADKNTSLALLSFAKGTASANGIAHMLTLARSEPGIPIVPAKLDAHPWLFNCINGTIDLKTGIRLPHNRQHNITKLCPHPYLVGAEGESPIWDLTIDRIFGGNAELIGFFRRLCGSAIVGEVIEHILAILWGCGSNGKSLIVETLLDAFGHEYADKGAPELLLAANGDRHPTEKADLFGKRLIICNETENGSRLAECSVKELTGGDTVKARRMREDFWSFKPSHSLLLVTNHKPVVKGTDHGIWRRLRLVPFTQRFWDASKGETGPAECEADSRLKEKLRPELPGIVRWLVDACREWQRDGLGQPAAVTAATADYREAMDVLAAFLDECCVLADGTTVKASEVRRRYDEWCKANGERPVSGRRFGEYLADRGIVKRTSNGTWYSGLSLS